MQIVPRITQEGKLTLYQALQLTVFVGDIFQITPSQLGQVNAIYDRAALVALPFEMRQQYAQHLMLISGHAPQLLICFEYDQNLMSGPPFSINEAEVKAHYSKNYSITRVDKQQYYAKIKGKVAPMEDVWLLSPH